MTVRRNVFVMSSRAVALLALFGSLTACGGLEPWVKPYERDRLADPIMSFDRDPVSSSYMHHVYEAREGARGANGSAGGGCGCN
jgi:predicted small lipoprotein YifL